MIYPCDLAERVGQRRGREGSAGKDGQVGCSGIEFSDLFAMDDDVRMGCKPRGDAGGERDTIDGEGVSCRDCGQIRVFEQKTIQRRASPASEATARSSPTPT